MTMWKLVPEFSAYEVSDEGQIRRSNTNHSNWHGKKPGQLLTPYGKYGKVSLIRDDGKLIYRNMNRIMLLTFVGPPPNADYEAAHIDDNQSNNKLSNLRWSTKADNELDRKRNGKVRKEHTHWKARLTFDDAVEIIKLRHKGLTYRAIGEIYGINLTHAYGICVGRVWPRAKSSLESSNLK